MVRLQVLVVKDQQGRQTEIDEQNPQDETRLHKTRQERQDKDIKTSAGSPPRANSFIGQYRAFNWLRLWLGLGLGLGYWKGENNVDKQDKIR